MRIGFQILQCPVSYPVRDALHHMVGMDIDDEDTQGCQLGCCAIINGKKLGSSIARYISSQNVLFFFCKRIETGLAFLDSELNSHFVRNKKDEFYEKARNGQYEDYTRDRAIIIVQCWGDVMDYAYRNKKNNETGDSEGCKMTWSEFEKFYNRFNDFHECHNIKS